jgi:hypothetical protein
VREARERRQSLQPDCRSTQLARRSPVPLYRWTADPTEKVFEIFIKTTPERLWEAITDARLAALFTSPAIGCLR